jgi:N-acyl-D-amino-acid deacylase
MRPCEAQHLRVHGVWNQDSIDTVFDLPTEDEAFIEAAMFAMAEPDVTLPLQHPHPRAGTFPHILRKYVREEKKLTLEDAIRKFAAWPAERMRIADRGVPKTGCGRTWWSSIRRAFGI